jgi:Ca-activated chloride channel family protein
MISFAWPWLWLALPLPGLVRLFMPRVVQEEGMALRVPSLRPFALVDGALPGRRAPGTRSRMILAALAWLLLVAAAARPLWLGEPVSVAVSGRDLMLAVDLSGSMEVEDFVLNGRQVSRLAATQALASDFIQRRQGDRIGLILFGRQAYVQTPLTFDRQTVSQLLNEAVIGLAGKETAIGDAIGLAVKRLEQSDGQSRVLILLTDGANTAGEVDPVSAAGVAADQGLRIHTIGIGADEMLVRSLFGNRRVNPSADLDEKTLKAIAEGTGGRYFRARDSEALAEIYRLLDQLEPVEREAQTFRPLHALYPWPLAGSLAVAMLLLVLSPDARGTRP